MIRLLVFALSLALPVCAQSSMTDLAVGFSPCDLDGDGTPEIVALHGVGAAGDETATCVVVLVEARLLRARDGVDPASIETLRQRIDRFAGDLAAEGHRAEIVSAEVHSGPPHQDGRTVLALRRFLAACAESRHLAGAILVGHFPDALLLRTCNWRKHGSIELRDDDGRPVRLGKDTHYLRRITERVAHRCDLILADLDGHWEPCYRQADTEYPGFVAAFDGDVPERGGVAIAWKPAPERYADAFHVDDGAAAIDPASRRVTIDDAVRDHECTAADRAHGNPIARPDIAVSRLDARGVAWRPRAGFLDAEGDPQAVEFGEGARVPGAAGVWVPDPDLELRLLAEYFDRNHAFRTSPIDPASFRPASIAWGLGSGMRSLRAASAEWAGFAEPGYDVHDHVDLCALVDWLRRPAVLRTLRAHSNGLFAGFAPTDPNALQRLIGGPPWSWVADEKRLEPSLAASCRAGHADFWLYRTLWADHALPACPYLLVHTGCEAVSPPGADRLRYDAPAYGRFGQAASLLFFTPCLALVGRAKVFYDEPRGFSEALAAGETFGAAWQRYFAAESAAASFGQVGGDIGRKRAYFWSVLGDWTLRLRR